MLLYCLGLEKLSYERRSGLSMRPVHELGATKWRGWKECRKGCHG